MRDVCVHAFFSDGLYGFAEVFLEAIKLHHGKDLHIILETLDLSEEKVHQLQNFYPNVEIRNKPLDYNKYSQLTGEDIETLKRWKNEVESVVTSTENFRWKILMSVEERYRSMLRIASEAREAGFKVLIHSDIDLYFRKKLDGLVDFVRSNDVSITFNDKGNKFKVLGALIGFSLNENSIGFLEEWMKQIDSIPTKDKPRGYGQTSFSNAYLEQERECKWGDLKDVVTISKMRDTDADIWIGNSHRGRNRKEITVEVFNRDLEEKKRRPDSYLGSADYKSYHFRTYSRQAPSDSFLQRRDALLNDWVQRTAQIDNPMQELDHDVFFAFLPKIRRTFQLNLCFEMMDYGAPNPARYESPITLRDPESKFDFKGAGNFLGLSDVYVRPLSNVLIESDSAEAVCVAGLLEHFSKEDIIWMIEEVFTLSEHLAIFVIDLDNSENSDFPWWNGLISGIASFHEGINYRIFAQGKNDDGDLIEYEASRHNGV